MKLKNFELSKQKLIEFTVHKQVWDELTERSSRFELGKKKNKERG
jgi:hypothetical protein